MSSLEKKAHAIHGDMLTPGKSPRPFNSTTVAVATLQGPNGIITVAATSAGKLKTMQIATARALSVISISEPKIKGPLGHAERAIIDRYAKENNMQVLEVAASRPICCDCEAVILGSGAKPASPLKRKK